MNKYLHIAQKKYFNEEVGPGKNPKFINAGPTFILKSRVARKMKKYLLKTQGHKSKCAAKGLSG